MVFEKFKGKNGDHYFRLRSSNGTIVLQSEGYKSSTGVDKGISAVRNNANPDSFEMRKTQSGDSYFILKAANGRIVGKSLMYKSAEEAKRGVKAVINNSKGRTKSIKN